MRQSGSRADAREARRRSHRTRSLEQHEAALHRDDRSAARPRVRQDVLQFSDASYVRDGRRRCGGRVRGPRSRSDRDDHIGDRNQSVSEPGLARAAVRGSARRLPLPDALSRFRPQRPDHHERSPRADRGRRGCGAPAAAGRSDRVHPYGVLSDVARLHRRPDRGSGLDAAVRAGPEEFRRAAS